MRHAGPRLAPGLAADTLQSLAAIAVVGASSALYNLAVGRFLGATALGHAGLALGVGLGVAQVAVSGVGPATTRFTAAARSSGSPMLARSYLRRGLLAALALGAAAAAAAWLTAPLWAWRVGLPRGLLAAAAGLALTQSAYLGLKAGLYGLGQVRGYAAIEATAGLAFAVALAALLLGVRVSLVAPFLAANLLFVTLAAVLVVVVLTRQPPAPGRQVVRAPSAPVSPAAGPAAAVRSQLLAPRGMLGFALIATGGSSAALARLSLVPLVTGAWWPAGEVGLVQAALAFLLVVMLVPRALELALFPSLSSAHGRGDAAALRDQAERSLTACAVVLGALSGALLLAGRPLLVGLYGPAFLPAASALTWVVVSGWAIGLAVPAVAALSGADAVAVPNTAAVLGLAASVLVWVWRVPTDGAAGAALGLAVGSLVNAAIPLVAARRLLGVRLGAAARVVGVAVTLSCVGLWVCRETGLPPLAASAAYLAAFAWLQRGPVAELHAWTTGFTAAGGP